VSKSGTAYHDRSIDTKIRPISIDRSIDWHCVAATVVCGTVVVVEAVVEAVVLEALLVEAVLEADCGVVLAKVVPLW
jgi:hypothetical protein